MAKINKKYTEDFDKLFRDWEKLKSKPNKEGLNLVMQDLQQVQRDIQSIQL